MLTITGISPISALPGTVVTVYGTGFIAAAVDDYVVIIGGENAAVLAMTATELQFTVPASIGTGPVDVTVKHLTDEDEATLPLACYLLAAPAAHDPGNLLLGGARAVFLDGRPVGLSGWPGEAGARGDAV